jgi:hypothetical protein
MATSVNQDMTIFAGNDVDIIVTVTDADGTAVNITGVTMTYVLGTEVGAAAATVTKTVGGGITLTTPASGIATINLDPDDTTSLEGTYYHELEITSAASEVNTGFIGEVTINGTLAS